jgi:transcriptional regulator with XRE-family HTH domain
MPRSLRVSRHCITKARLAVQRNGFCSQRILAENVGLSLSTVSNFLTGKSVYYSTFIELCSCLSLEWKEIAEPLNSFDLESNGLISLILDKNFEQLKVNEQGEYPNLYFENSEELAALSQWIVQESCRLLSQLDPTETEKIGLLLQLKQQVQSDFEAVIERSQHSVS